MGNIKKVNRTTGEVLGEIELNEEVNVLGKPFLCVYEASRPRVAEGLTILEKPLVGNVKCYVRFASSDEINAIIAKDEGSDPSSFQGGSIVATKDLLEHYEMSEDDVFAEAFKNTIEGKLEVVPMNEIASIGSLCPLPPIPARVVRVDFGFGRYGANVLAVPCMLEQVREKIGDYYIIPSSLDEIIAYPKSLGREVEFLRMMVKEVNATVVAPDEVLSNDVFVFDENGLALA